MRKAIPSGGWISLLVATLLYSGLPGSSFAQTLQHRYSFTNDASDSVGGANGSLVGNVSISGGALVLPGGGNSDSPQGYVVLSNGIVSNDTSITVDCWLTDTAGGVWAEAWCLGDSAAGPGANPSYGTSYISLIPHSAYNDLRAAFNNSVSEIDVIGPGNTPLPLDTEEYVSVTYDATSATARLYLNGVQIATANIPADHAPSTFGDTFNDWLGRDEWGPDPMFAGSIDELRIWNGAMPSIYVALSALAGPNVVLTNFTPQSIVISAPSPSMFGGQSQQMIVTANFSQATNIPATTAATNWQSSNPSVLSVSSSGLVTGGASGSARISATVYGVTATGAPITVTSLNVSNLVTVAYWQFSDSADLGIDSSGLGNNLTVGNGNPVYSPDGLFGGALYLDGNSTMTMASGAFPVAVPTNDQPYSIAVWEKIDSGCPNNGGFIGWGDNNYSEANDFRLNGPNSADDYWYANDFVPTGLAVNPMDGNWHVLIVTWDGTNQILYVDGANVASRVPGDLPFVQPANFVVGKTTADVNFRGWMEDLLITSVPLTPAEVAVYQTGQWSGSLAAFPEQPVAAPSNNVYAQTTVTLTVPVAGTPPFLYQWQFDGTNLPAATNASLILANATVADAGSYDVIVGDPVGTNTSPTLVLTVNPASKPVFAQQPTPAAVTKYPGGVVTFSAAVVGTQPIALQWQRNGANLANDTASSLTLLSLQAAEAGTYTLVASNSLGAATSAPAVLTMLANPNPSALNVLTYHNDNYRDGANTNETTLTPANVNVATFGRLLQYPTDGYIYAEPLYVSGLVIPGQGAHDVVFVATENDSIYAFDADSNAGTNGGVLWHVNLGTAVNSFNGEFGTRYQGTYYGDIVPVVGITGTPVIDLNSGTLYVDVHTREVTATSTNYFHRIHALNITNGAEQAYSPVAVTNSVPGVGVNSTNGVVSFNPIQENQRPGMTLVGGMLFAAYGSYADSDPYHGWILGFNATNLAQSSTYVFNTTPNATVATFGVNAGEGALWMGGDGLCADAHSNLYFAVGNGSFSANTNGGDYGDSFVKLSTSNNGLGVADYFTPSDQATLAENDTDLGSGGTILLPDEAGSAAHPHLMVGAGKDGVIRIVDRDNMGGFNANNDQVVEESQSINGAWSTPAYFNHHIYYQATGDIMRSFLITNGYMVPSAVSRSGTAFSALGGTPCISANGTNDAIAWTLQSDAYGSGGPYVLHAYNATNLSQELYNTSQNLGRDNPGAAIKMTTPTIANGKVFVGAQYALSIFGNSLFLTAPLITPNGGLFTNSVTVTLTDSSPNATIYYTLDGTAPTTNSLVYTVPFTLNNSASVQAIAAEPGAANSAVTAAGFVDTSAQGDGTGLEGSYWANVTGAQFTNSSFSTAPTLTRTDPTVNFNWTSTVPAASIGLSNFVVRWTGTVQPEYSETYTFATMAAGGVRLFVNGQLLINKWVNQSETTYISSITLQAQELYNIEMDYFNQNGGAQAQLYWSSPSTPSAILPQSQLYPVTNPPPSVSMVTPPNGASFTATASVTLSADADALYNPLSYVNFYANGAYLASVTNPPYAITVTGLPPGTYTLTAKATDGSGLTGSATPSIITVKSGTGLAYGLTANAPLAAFLNGNMPGAYTGALPQTLSATGAYIDTPSRTPSPGLIPYVPNTPLWSDNAVKSRYLGLPYSGGYIAPAQQIAFAPTGQWSFPQGTVFVKNFDLVVNQTNSSVPVRRLETRLLVRDTNGAVYGVTYKWRPDNSDADLLTGSLTEAILVTNAAGVFTQNWYYPSPADCLTCHTAPADYVLGVNSRQLNGLETYPSTGVTDSQLRTLNRLGLLNPAFDEAAISGYEKLSSVTNTSAPLVERARSYLDANCAQCHQPGGTGITFDARYDTPLANQNIVNYPAAFSLGYDNAKVVAPSDIWRSVLYDRINSLQKTIQMPPLARNMIDSNAVAAMAEWINSLGGTPALPPPVLTPSGGTFVGSVMVSAQDATNDATLYYTLDGTLPTTNSLLYTGPVLVTEDTTVNVNAWASGYVNSVAASAQFSVIPGISFVSPGGFTNGVFQMSFAGLVGSNYILQVSSDLIHWTSISTNTAAASPFLLTDPNPSAAERFYRVLQQ